MRARTRDDVIAKLDAGDVLTRAEVACLFGVWPDTVGRWAKSGRLASFWTAGGRRRYLASDVVALYGGKR